MGTGSFAYGHGGSFYPPLSPNKSLPLQVYSSQPFPANASWMTCIKSTLDDRFFLLGSASNDQPGLFAFSNREQRGERVPGVTEKVWAMSSSSTKEGNLLILQTDNKLMLGNLKIQGNDEMITLSRAVDMKIDLEDRVEQIEMRPKFEDQFALRTADSVQIWSFESGSRCRSNCAVTTGQNVGYFTWNPHDGNILACSTIEQGFNLYDIRSEERSIPFSRNLNTSSQSRIRWNPFIPYWTAISTDDSVHIYDLRYVKESPLRTFSTSHPNDFCWSNANCELLMSASSGRVLSLWNLQNSKQQQLPAATIPHGNCGGDIVSLFSSSRDLHVIYGMTILGRLVRIDIQESLLASLAPHSHEGDIAKDIETALYCRDFASVYECLLEYSNSATLTLFKDLQFMTNQTIPSIPIAADSWKYSSLSIDDNSFLNDVQRYSRVCPPGFDISPYEVKSGMAKDVIELVRLKVKILELVQQSNGEILMSLFERIHEAMSTNPEFLTIDSLLKIISLTIKANRLDTLKFGRNILENSSRLDGDSCSLVHYLLFPTIFDFDAAKLAKIPERSSPAKAGINKNNRPLDPMRPPSPLVQSNDGQRGNNNVVRFDSEITPASGKCLMELHKAMRSIKCALSMIDLEILVEETTCVEERTKIITEEFSSSDKRTVSAKLVWEHLEILLERSQLDLYFAHIGKLTISSSCNDFGMALLDYFDKVVIPRVKYILVQAIDTQRPSLVVKAIHLITTLVLSINPLPDGLEPFLIDRLRRLVRAMYNEDYSGMSGYSQLVSYLQSVSIPTSGDGIWKDLFSLQARLIHSSSM